MENAPHRGWATIKEKHILKSDFHNGRSREHLTSVSLRCPSGVRTRLKTLQHQIVLWRNASEVPQIHTPYLSLIPILRTSISPHEWLRGSFVCECLFDTHLFTIMLPLGYQPNSDICYVRWRDGLKTASCAFISLKQSTNSLKFSWQMI